MREIQMKCFPGSSQHRERFPVEIREEYGMFQKHGDCVTRYVL